MSSTKRNLAQENMAAQAPSAAHKKDATGDNMPALEAASRDETRCLLLELLTEELPPRALETLGQAFARSIHASLAEQGLIQENSPWQAFATPRRLAVRLDAVLSQAPDHAYEIRLMPAHIGFDAQGKASAALLKKLEALDLADLDPAQLSKRHDGKQEMLYATGTASGIRLTEALQTALDLALQQLPIPKLMQYQLADGHTSVKFVRPAHRLLALWGPSIVPVKALGLMAGRITQGHRFQCKQDLSMPRAEQWEEILREKGKVVPSFAARRALVAEQLSHAARQSNASIGSGPEVESLIDEVTALVEYPTVYSGAFDERYLQIPAECLILTMRLHQRYFPLFDAGTGKLGNRFLIVSNMQPANPENIIRGNQRVIRPRLADAEFFYQTDLKTPLHARVASLADSIYHHRLGSELERSKRVQHLAGWLAEQLGADVAQARRAAWLAHADLNSLMVGEFPELQGIMGAYYAAHDGEPAAVVRALREQYRLRLTEPVSDDNLVATVLYMAARAETLVGIWGIGLSPTGERDPYGLRRAALGLISAYEQLVAGGVLAAHADSPARLSALLTEAAQRFPAGILADDTVEALQDFIFERYRNQLLHDHERDQIDAVLALRPALHQVRARLQACHDFTALPQAESLASANRRIANLLKKNSGQLPDFQPELLQEEAEKELADTIDRLAPQAHERLQAGDFTGSLNVLASAHQPVNRFFDEVMVMTDDEALRNNRLALLQALHTLMNQVADLSRLAR